MFQGNKQTNACSSLHMEATDQVIVSEYCRLFDEFTWRDGQMGDMLP